MTILPKLEEKGFCNYQKENLSKLEVVCQPRVHYCHMSLKNPEGRFFGQFAMEITRKLVPLKRKSSLPNIRSKLMGGKSRVLSHPTWQFDCIFRDLYMERGSSTIPRNFAILYDPFLSRLV